MVWSHLWKTKNEEIATIEHKNTWELTDLLKGHKTIGVKWVYKTKLRENGEVDKFKVRLIAKGYKQQFGVDYKRGVCSYCLPWYNQVGNRYCSSKQVFVDQHLIYVEKRE